MPKKKPSTRKFRMSDQQRQRESTAVAQAQKVADVAVAHEAEIAAKAAQPVAKLGGSMDGRVMLQPVSVPGSLADLAGADKGSDTKMSGSSGVYSYGGRLVSFERKPELVGRNLFTTFDNAIANTTIIGAAIRYFGNLIGGTAWTVTAKEETDSQKLADKAADIVQEGLFNSPMTMPWSTIARRASLYKYYGFSIHEWCVRRRPSDGMIVFKDIEHRPQATIDMWDIPNDGSPFVGVVQLIPMQPRYFYVPRERMLYCVDNSLTDQPNGVGLMRHVIEHARRLERYEQLEGFGYEGDLRGTPVGRVPGAELRRMADAGNLGAQWVADQESAVNAFVQKHIKTPFQGIVLDSETYVSQSQNGAISTVPKWAIDIIKGNGGPLAEIAATIERINREIARVLGMEFLLLGGDGKGSLALSRDKTSMFASVMEATLGELAWFTTHDLVYPLLELNGIDPEKYCPKIIPDPIATERIEAVVAALVGLAQAGSPLMPDDPAINQIRARLHLANQPKLSPQALGVVTRGAMGTPPQQPGAPGAGGKPGAADGKTPKPVGGGVVTPDKPESVISEDRKDQKDTSTASPSARAKSADARTLFRHVDPDDDQKLDG